MKTQNNNQGTSRNQVSKIGLYAGAFIFSVVLIGKTTNAQNYWDQLSTSNVDGKLTTLSVVPSSETKQADAALNIIYAEVNNKLNNSSELKYGIDTSLT